MVTANFRSQNEHAVHEGTSLIKHAYNEVFINCVRVGGLLFEADPKRIAGDIECRCALALCASESLDYFRVCATFVRLTDLANAHLAAGTLTIRLAEGSVARTARKTV